MEREFVQHIMHQSQREKEAKLQELRHVEEQVKRLERIEQAIVQKLQRTIDWEKRQISNFKEEVNHHRT